VPSGLARRTLATLATLAGRTSRRRTEELAYRVRQRLGLLERDEGQKI
jgi:hypothetical protein